MRPGDYERLSELGTALHGGLGKVRVTVDSADGLVTVVAGAWGEVLELELDPRIYHDPNADALAKKITDTILVAREEARHASERFLTKLMNGHDRTLHPLLAPLHKALESDDGRR